MKPTRTALAGATLAAALLLTGCGGANGGGDADGGEPEAVRQINCLQQLRIAGVVYEGVGYVEDRDAAVTPTGRAEVSSCDDTGAYFTSSPGTVPVFTFAGQDADRVVAADFPIGYAAYVVESVRTSEQQATAKIVQVSAGDEPTMPPE